MPRSALHSFSALLLAAASIPCMPPRAGAERPLFATTWAQETLEGVAQGLESPELRVLRMAEEELFGSGPGARPDAYDPDCVYGAPDALSSDAPPPRIERAETRRQLLEYQLATGARCVLLVDPDAGTITEVSFPITLPERVSSGSWHVSAALVAAVLALAWYFQR